MDPNTRTVWQRNMPLLYEQYECRILCLPTLSSCFLNNLHRPEFSETSSIVAISTLLPYKQSSITLYHIDPSEEMNSINKQFVTFNDGFGFTNSNKELDKYTEVNNEIHKIRQSVVAPNLLAAATANGVTRLFEITESNTLNLACSLAGHSKEVWGLAWSSLANRLLTSGDDGNIFVWDINDYSIYNSNDAKMLPTKKCSYKNLTLIQAIEASKEHPDVFFTGDDNSNLLLWDLRTPDPNALGFPLHYKSSKQSFNSISNNQFRPYLLATGGSNLEIDVIDIRMPNFPLTQFEGHSNSINSIEWNPLNENLLASASLDNKILIWDLSLNGAETLLEANDDENSDTLIFTHLGHIMPVQDLNWSNSLKNPNAITSVDDSGVWTYWMPQSQILLRESEYYDHLEFENDDS